MVKEFLILAKSFLSLFIAYKNVCNDFTNISIDKLFVFDFGIKNFSKLHNVSSYNL